MSAIRTRHPASAAQVGFTLLELMTAITVLAILLGIGVPAFTEMIASNRLTATTNQMITALNLARSESSKRGIPVTVCASNAAQNACDNDPTAWTAGWLVFTDDTGTAGTIDGTDELLQKFPAAPQGYTVVAADPNTMSHIRFLRSGAPDSALLSRTLKLTRPSCSGTKARQVIIANTGRISSGKTAC